MVNVAFYLPNNGFAEVDCSKILEANPGIGGSEYMIITIATLLTKNEHINIIIYMQKEMALPIGVKYKLCKTFSDAIAKANEIGADFFLFKHEHKYIAERTIPQQKIKVNLIPWCHNFVQFKDLDFYSSNVNIIRILCVGREQMMQYEDHIAFNKSDYIYNCINFNRTETYQEYSKRKNIVTYIGSLTPSKGVHWLTDAWPEVIKKVPDAKLYIIGGENLYSRILSNEEKNKWYKDRILRGISSPEIMSSVHFTGVLGKEKNKILAHTKVGVPNPSGYSETFGITAVEMQLFGCKIATIKCPGYFDTVYNGILYNQKSDLAPSIVKLLLDKEDSENKNYQKILTKKFSYQNIYLEWCKYLLEIIPNKKYLNEDREEYSKLDYGILRHKLRLLKERHAFLYKILPPVNKVLSLINKIDSRKNRLPHICLDL